MSFLEGQCAPARSLVFPLRRPRDDYVTLLPAGGFDDPGILRDSSHPLVLYQLTWPYGQLFAVKGTDVSLRY